MVTQEEVRLSDDARGFIYEPLDASELAAQQNVHVVVSGPGAVRGNHRHARTNEIMTVHGPALVRWEEGGRTVDRVLGDGDVVRFTFPAGVAHAIRNTGSAPNLLVSFTDQVHDPARPDVERVELIPPA
jgi:dTDP-4-dehydrorhamnose 3,5-epimerase-like enzyme